MGIAHLPLALVLAGSAAPAESSVLVRKVVDAQIDWSEGLITARAGSAADFRLPSPDVARPGAERRARAAALAKLKAALQAVAPHLTPAVLESTLGRAKTASIEYQSNGGVVLILSLRFADLAPDENDPPVVLKVPAMPLEWAPRIASGEGSVSLGWAVYRLGTPDAGENVVAAERDRSGRLRLAGRQIDPQKLAGKGAVIYVGKVQR